MVARSGASTQETVSPIKVNTGQDKQALCLAGAGTTAGYINTSGAITYTATTVTPTASPSWTVNAWAGRYVFAGTVYGIIVSNTATALTVDRWYNPATPTGAAATTPAANTSFAIFGSAPVFYMALTANTSAPSATDTALTGEITTAGGGLIRQAAAYAHTTSATTYTLTGSYTVNGSDTLGPIIHKIGTFDTLTPATGIMLHETVLSADATLSAVGDSLTVTQTVTM